MTKNCEICEQRRLSLLLCDIIGIVCIYGICRTKDDLKLPLGI